MLDHLLEPLKHGRHKARHNLVQVLELVLLPDGAAAAGVDLEGMPESQVPTPLPALVHIPVNDEVAVFPVMQLQGVHERASGRRGQSEQNEGGSRCKNHAIVVQHTPAFSPLS